ncbi:hypothetical protein DMENIID0001_092990 [Sergentomyia squamirostris]
MTQRTFASGSKRAPDPHDQFLEMMGYYRKHTGRDPSNLFRVISEQLYDTQKYHEFLREECVRYLRRHRKYWSQFVLCDFDNYLMDLSKPRTFGGIIELRALAARFERNIFVFESIDSNYCSSGKYFDFNSDFTNDFTIFYIPGHYFDTVYTTGFMENMAFCQAITYEILYRHVYQLPDINYAVERMLYDPHGLTTSIVEDPSYRLCGEYSDFDEIRQFYLDPPERTKCVLNDSQLCHFHNPNFHEFVTRVQRAERQKVNQENKTRILQSMLPIKDLSCVRQLLKAKITPFPYKVAKSLDPYIYRNVDFDVWAEVRRERRAKRFERGFPRIGEPCLVKLHKSKDHLYSGYIRDFMENESCQVYVEELGEMRRVPLFYIYPQDFQRKSYLKYNRDETSKKGCDLIEYTKMGDIKPYPVEIVAMPVMAGKGGEDNGDKRNSDNEKKPEEDFKVEEIKPVMLEDDYGYGEEVMYAQSDTCFYGYDAMGGVYMMPQYGIPMPYYPNYYMYSTPLPSTLPPAPMPLYSVPPPPPYLSLTPPNTGPHSPNSQSQGSGALNSTSGSHRDQLGFYFNNINYNVAPSTVLNGGDLPLYDLPTVQFFFNAGIEYFSWLKANYGLSQAIYGLCERQGLPMPNLPTDLEESHERLYPPPLMTVTKIDDESQQMQDMLSNPPPQIPQQKSKQPETDKSKSHHSGNHSNRHQSNVRSNRKEQNTQKGSKKYNGKNHNHGELNNLSKGGHRYSSSKGHKSENMNFSPNIVDDCAGIRSEGGVFVDQSTFGMIQPYPMFSSGGEAENNMSLMQPYGGPVSYYGNQGISGQIYSTVAPASMPMTPCVVPDMGMMPPSPIYTQAPPPPVRSGLNGNGSNGEMGHYCHHTGSTVGGGGGNNIGGASGGGSGSKGSDGVSSYCIIPPPPQFQYQQPPPPLMTAPPPTHPANNWFQITPRAVQPVPSTSTMTHNGGNIPAGIYSPNNDLSH